MTCTRCGAAFRSADPECPRCGLPLTPSTVAAPSAVAPAAGPRAGATTGRSWLALGGGVFVLLLGAVIALSWFGRDDSDGLSTIGQPPGGELRTEQLPPAPPPSTGASAGPENPSPTGENLATTATITAARTAPPGQDDQNQPVTYGTDNLADGDLSTAWRAPGFYNGQAITFELAAPSRIQILGLTNGYTKRDPASGADRYDEGRRILSVTWTFDNGRSVQQTLEDGVRTVQRIKIDPIRTRTVKLTVDATTTPGKFTSDFTAISEVLLEP